MHLAVYALGLSSCERWVLGADVALGAGGRLEGHGTVGALVEDLAVGSLNVGLDGVQSSEHDLATRAPRQSKKKRKKEILLHYFTAFWCDI